MPTKGTKHRNIRIPDAVWDAAKIRAAERGETVSGIVNAALVEYVAQAEDDPINGQPR